MLEITNEKLKQVQNKLEYIGLNLEKIPTFLKKEKVLECNLEKEYRDTTYKVYKYIDVNDIEIFITPELETANVSQKCKTAKIINEYFINESLRQSFIEIAEKIDMSKFTELENEQNKFDISLPYTITYKTALKWRIYYSKKEKKYFMLISKNEKDIEAMFLLLKKQIQSNTENVAIKIYIPIANEYFSQEFLTNLQVTDIENSLWSFTKKWPNVYEAVDIYGKRSMHIIGKLQGGENIQSYYKILIKDKKEAIEKYELLKQLFLIQSNAKDQYTFNVQIDESGFFQIFYNDKEIVLSDLKDFLHKQSEEKITETKKIIEKTDEIDIKLEAKKEELETKKEEFNQKQKQIVTFLQCKKTFLGRFKYFFKSTKKSKKINRIAKIQKVELINPGDENNEIYEKKDVYNIDDLLAICNILSKNFNIYNSKMKELDIIDDKIDALRQKIKNADLYILEIEKHKKSIFEFWKFTNKDLPNELNEAEKEQDSNESDIDGKSDFNIDNEKLVDKMDMIQAKLLSKNERNAIFAIKDYIQIIDNLDKDVQVKEDELYIANILKQELEKYEKETKNQTIIYYNSKQNININNKNTNTYQIKDKYKILNFHSNMNISEFMEQLVNTKKIMEKAYKRIKVLFNFSAYCILKNNQMNEWNLANLSLEDLILKEKSDNIDVLKYNIPKESPVLFYTNSIIYEEQVKNSYIDNNLIIINLNEFEIELKQKHKDIINILNDNYKNVVKTIKIYEYDLKYKEKQ